MNERQTFRRIYLELFFLKLFKQITDTFAKNNDERARCSCSCSAESKCSVLALMLGKIEVLSARALSHNFPALKCLYKSFYIFKLQFYVLMLRLSAQCSCSRVRCSSTAHHWLKTCFKEIEIIYLG